MKNNIKKIAGIALLTAAYCVLSALMKIPFIGSISLDLGYIALTVACSAFGPWGAFVGAVGCGLESILFSTYGFSISWFCANLLIGLGCGFVFKYTKKIWVRILAIVGFVFIGMCGVKTGIECALYNIPFAVKIVKNLVAFGVDSAVMIIGLGVANVVEKIIHRDADIPEPEMTASCEGCIKRYTPDCPIFFQRVHMKDANVKDTADEEFCHLFSPKEDLYK